MSCPRDTDGDGNCGNIWCPDCGTAPNVVRARTDRQKAELFEELVEALEENVRKRHEYGMWIADLVKQCSSHTEPFEKCQSPGCLKNQPLLNRAKEVGK